LQAVISTAAQRLARKVLDTRFSPFVCS